MKFAVQRKNVPYGPTYIQKDYETARHFAKRIHEEFGIFIKAVVLFGGSSKEQKGDIDILIIVDNVTYKVTPEITETYRIVTEKIAHETSHRLHITTLRFTSFWEYVRIGDPVGMNILRTGLALIDTGFFYPLQMMLHDGRIRPSMEAIGMYNARSKATLLNSKNHIIQAVIDLYWAVMDASQAAVMSVGELPPSPKEIGKVLENLFVPRKLDKNNIKLVNSLYKLSKDIMHREIKEIEGKRYDFLLKESKVLIDKLNKISG